MPETRSPLRRSSALPLVAGVVVLVALVAAAVLWLRRANAPSMIPTAPVTEATDAGPPASSPAAPPLDEAQARSLVESVSKGPLVQKGLAGPDLPRRAAVVLDNLATGESPRKALAFLAPSRPFAVVTRGARSYIGPGAYQRYDGFAEAVSTVDAGTVATLYRGLHRALEEAHRALGYPSAALDDVTGRALHRLEAAPVPAGDVEVVPEGGLYRFADPKLEAQGEIEKHLLRMGPRNTRLVAAKAKELREALGLR